MTIGNGAYHTLTEIALSSSMAEAVLLIVVNGAKGSSVETLANEGFDYLTLADVLETTAAELRKEFPVIRAQEVINRAKDPPRK